MLPTVSDIAMVSAGHRSSSGKQGSAKGHTGPGSGKGKAGSGRSAKAAVPGSKGSQASAEPPPQESFYVYESVMPPEVRGIVQQWLDGWHCCCICDAIMFQACSAILTVAILCPAAYIAAPLERFAVQTPLVAALAAIVHVLRVL